MNYITDGYKKHFDFSDCELIGTSPIRLYSDSISNLFAQASNCGYLTQADRYQLMIALLATPLSEEEQAAIDRLLYAVCRGRIRLVETVSEEFSQPPLSQADHQSRVESCLEEPFMLLVRRSVEPLSRSHYIDLASSWQVIEVMGEIA